MQPEFCKYCGKNVADFLRLVHGMKFCPFCTGDLKGYEDEYADLVTAPEKPVLLPVPNSKRLVSTVSKERKKECVARIMRKLEKAGKAGVTRTKMSWGLLDKSDVWVPIIDEMIEKGLMRRESGKNGGTVYYLAEKPENKAVEYDPIVHISAILKKAGTAGMSKTEIDKKTQMIGQVDRDKAIQTMINKGIIKNDVIEHGSNGGPDKHMFYSAV